MTRIARRRISAAIVCLVVEGGLWASATSARQSAALPSTPLTFGFFTARFDPAGMFTLEGEGWPPFKGTWSVEASTIASRFETSACT